MSVFAFGLRRPSSGSFQVVENLEVEVIDETTGAVVPVDQNDVVVSSASNDVVVDVTSTNNIVVVSG